MDGEMTSFAEDEQVVGPFLAAPLVRPVVNVEPTASAAGLASVVCAPERAATQLRPFRCQEVVRVRHRPEGFLPLVPGSKDLIVVQLAEREDEQAVQPKGRAASVEPLDQEIGGFVMRVV
jgi:hypothetical protein